MTRNAEFYKNLVDNLFDGVYFVDRDRVITYWNHGAERISGYSAARVVGHSCRDNLLNHVTAEGVQLCKDLCPLAACIRDGKEREVEVFLHHAEGNRVPVRVRAAPIRDEKGKIVGAVETFTNISEAMDDRRELKDLRVKILTDPLTGIHNRLYLERRLRGAMAEQKGQTPTTALLFIDIDHFKDINDQHGHAIGDQILRMTARTLVENIRDTDIAGRWGGEEFIILLFDVPSKEALMKIAEKLRVLVQHSRLDIAEKSFIATISIGATFYRPEDDAESIVKRADELMYKSKESGRNRVTIG